jgi:hypothetical protein
MQRFPAAANRHSDQSGKKSNPALRASCEKKTAGQLQKGFKLAEMRGAAVVEFFEAGGKSLCQPSYGSRVTITFTVPVTF